MDCKICSFSSPFFSKATVLGKHEVNYYRCGKCGFIQTEDPCWLEEARADPINRTDVGLVDRNIRMAAIARAVIPVFFNTNGKFLDYAGGYGIFVRIMRDSGYDFYHYDEHCENLFAQDYKREMKGGKFELITAFEVFEHLVNPLETICRILESTDNILMSTVLLPSPPPVPGNWWYYGLEHGQHVSFYTLDALSAIADKYGLNVYSDGSQIHLLTSKKLFQPLLKLLTVHRLAFLMGLLTKRTSLLEQDYRSSVDNIRARSASSDKENIPYQR